MISAKSNIDFSKYTAKLERARDLTYVQTILEKHAEKGLERLKAATPVDTGVTAASWYYELNRRDNAGWELVFKNSNLSEGIPVVILLEYGHVTKNGGYVSGNKEMSNVIDSIFNDMTQEIYEEANKT